MTDSETALFKRQWAQAQAETKGRPLDVVEQRTMFEALNADIALPSGCNVTEAPFGVRGEQITPARADTARTILYVHGGGFFFGSLRSHRHFVARLAERAGVRAISVDYALAPERPFPAAIGDLLAAYRALIENGTAAERIVIAGDSAGGNLAMALLLGIRREHLPQPAGVYIVSPWLDLTLQGESIVAGRAFDPILTPRALQEAAAMYLAGQSANDPLASPCFADLSNAPPLLIQVGSDEILLSDSMMLATRAAACGVDVTLRVWAGMPHAWPLFHNALTAGQRAIAEAGVWIRERLD